MNTTRKETLVKTLTSPSKSYALHTSERAVFEINDVKEVRDSDAVVIVDDEGARQAFWQPRVMRIFEGYNIPVYAFLRNQAGLTNLALSFAR